ncbi:MAG: extracellular solute-binding protein [Sphaerochaeta sp.]|jgi:multiple sugar transport system substrate-binding protein|uniref:extracellular solute-binding protein n=1 Tax=Sphaerochaeta sp. TaxID=1972642 RepID=UPI002FC99B61
MKKKLLVCALGTLLIGGMLFANGKPEQQEKITPPEQVVTTIPLSSYATEAWYKAMNDAFTAQTGIKVEVQVTPGTNDEQVAKVNLDLLAGSKVDVIPTLGPRDLNTRLDAGFFAPLKKATTASGVDVRSIWGKYIMYDPNGEFYSIPTKQEIYCLYYNKTMFDKAGIPYPKAPWTWDDFEKTAQMLTNAQQNEYGALMRLETPHIIIKALQEQVPLYKADGTSNFDDPAFTKSLQWFKELGSSKKYQMDVKQLLAEKASWNYWATVDNMAMFIQGNWFTRLLNSPSDYPRDWKYGVVAIPTTGKPESANNFVSMAYASINKNAAHPKEALEYILWLGQNQWRFEKGIPALENMSEEDLANVFKSTADASNGSITVDDLNKALIDNALNVINVDIVGPAAAEYNQIIKEEAERYCIDQQTLQVTVQRIKQRMDEVLKNV